MMSANKTRSSALFDPLLKASCSSRREPGNTCAQARQNERHRGREHTRESARERERERVRESESESESEIEREKARARERRLRSCTNVSRQTHKTGERDVSKAISVSERVL